MSKDSKAVFWCSKGLANIEGAERERAKLQSMSRTKSSGLYIEHLITG